MKASIGFARRVILKGAVIQICFLALLANVEIAVAQQGHYKTWTIYGGTPDQIHYSSLKQINTKNVQNLKVAWTFETGDAFGDGINASEMESTPVVVGKTLYIVSPKLRVFALDASTGRPLWIFDPNRGQKVLNKQRSRGVTYWSNGEDKRLFVTSRQNLYAIDASTGKAVDTFGNHGSLDLRDGLGRDPTLISAGANTPGIVFNDLLILGSTGWSPGDIRAYDVHNGKIAWSFHTIPHPGEFGYETWPKDAWKRINGANAWAGMALDAERGIVYVPTASPGAGLQDFFGGDREGDNLFGNTLLALDARTGNRLWHFQMVHHDLWDRDLPAPPSLVTIRRNGRDIDAVVQITKSGFVYVFDRVSGAPLFPIAERPVPQTHVDGEFPAETQPFPTAPAPFARQSLTKDLLTRRTPEAAQEVSEQFDKLISAGEFAPPSLRGTVLMPGLDGGGEWGGTSFDPETGLLYINSNQQPSILRLERRDSGAGELTGKSIYMSECSGCHGANRLGSPPEFPALVGVSDRLTKLDVFSLVARGGGRMPGFMNLGVAAIDAVVDFVVYNREITLPDSNSRKLQALESDSYNFGGYINFLDSDGYPAIEPPWGMLSALDVSSGKYVWQIPFGEYPELVEQGLSHTGSANYGGSVVTAGGLLFIGATLYDHKFRAFDKLTGKLLWETILPTAANATPAVYEIDGREFIALAVGGGKESNRPNMPGGSIYVFGLPETVTEPRTARH